MWELFLSFPRGRVSTRNFIMLLATFLVVAFGYIFTVAPTAHAADSASWKDNSLVYQDHTYKPLDISKTKGLESLPSDAQVYEYQDKSGGTTTANLLYFPGGITPKSATEAKYVQYRLNPPNTYSSPSGETTVTVTPVDPLEDKSTEDSSSSSCTVGEVGWIACPVMRAVASGMDRVYGVLQSFLSVQPLMVDKDNAVYRMWVYARDIANVLFVIAFMVIIYSQVTSFGVSNYGLKKLLPRIIIAAILVNLSYIVCSVLVDLSNIIGANIYDLLKTLRESALSGTGGTGDINWTKLTMYILGGGAAAIIGFSAVASAAGSISGLWFLLAPFLVGGALLVLVAFFILAARQALITILIAIAPLAFVAYLLPNTEKWFEKWRGLFFNMLFIYPAFAVVFGGAQIAGQIIINAGLKNESLAPILAILGLGVQVAPLAITPLLLKLGSGVLNRFAGIINNPQKGLYDRFKNYNNERRQDHLAKVNRQNADRRANGGFKGLRRAQVMRRTAGRNYARDRYRENLRKINEEGAEDYWHNQGGRWGYDSSGAPNRRSQLMRSTGYENLDYAKRTTEQRHKETEAKHDAHWKETMDIQSAHFNKEVFEREVSTRQLTDQAKLSDERLEVAWTEMKAGHNPFDSAGISMTGRADATKLKKQIEEINLTAQNIAAEGLKKQSAETVIKQTNAQRLKMHKELREYVGGIGGEDMAVRIFAAAKSEVVEDYMKSVKAMGSVQEAYDLNELISIAHTGIRPESVGGGKATEAEIDSAIQQIVTVKGNNWAFQKLKDRIAMEGVVYKDGKYYEQDGTTEISAEEAEGRRTRQQIFVDAAKNSKLSIKSLSGTDRGLLESGMFTTTSYGKNGAIIRDLRDQKINANRIADTDIDELMHMVQVLRDDEARGSLSEEARKSFRATMEAIESDPVTRSKIATREWKMINVVADYLDHPEALTVEQKKQIENQTETPIPTNYDPNRPYGLPAKFVPETRDGKPVPNREPYGPDGDMTYRGKPSASEESGGGEDSGI